MLRSKGAVRSCSREVLDDNVPDWPEEHRCECCGAAVWRVSREDGEDVVLDQRPLETHLILGKVRVRNDGLYRVDEDHPFAWKRAPGWRLEDPFYVHDSEYIADRSLGNSWTWAACRVPLTVDEPGLVFSEHYHLCSSVTVHSARAQFSCSTVNKLGAMATSRAHDQVLRKRCEATARQLSSNLPLLFALPKQPRLPYILGVDSIFAAQRRDQRATEARLKRAASPSSSPVASAHLDHPTADQLALF